MNERIKELARQASKELDPTAECLVSDTWRDKFAELIVREANDVVYGLLEENTGAEVVVRVKEHFGVE